MSHKYIQDTESYTRKSKQYKERKH